MTPSRLALFAASLLFLACGKDGNPVALPTEPAAGALTISVTSSVSQVQAGSSTAATLNVTARKADGTPAPTGTDVTLSTSLGYFALDADGKPIQLVTQTLTNGAASVPFFAGSEAGVAKILAQSGTYGSSLNLQIVAAPVPPVADFTFDATTLSVLFSDASTGAPTTYRWQFGDATESTEKNPLHTYRSAGTYVVTLIVTNGGGSSSKSKFVDVSLGTAPVAKFKAEVSGREVHFIDQSTGNPTSWSWIFGDGQSSTQRNPVHTYASPGTYTVVLTATNAAGSNSISDVVKIESGTPPVAKFKAEVTGRQVNFIDQSTGTPTSWSWDFGDGAGSSQQNPVHTYANPGTYTVTLTVTNASGSNSISDAVKIEAGTPPVAKFKFETLNRTANFVDQSTGEPTSWLWNFGDGSSSTQRNPTHTYATAGNYTVTLTVSNAAGSNSASDVVKIEAGTPPTANFTFAAAADGSHKVNFVDASTGNPTSWFWNFGDSGSSIVRNPEHTYAAAGNYTVTLTVGNAAGSTQVSKVVTVP